MAKKVTIYRDEFGGEHDTAEEADRSTAVLKAVRRFEEAAEELSKALLREATTGDGQAMTSMRSGHYWRVHRFVRQWPFMQQVWIWPHSCDVVIGQDGAIRYRAEERDSTGKATRIEVPINQLYCSQETAQRRLAELLKEMIAEATEQIQNLDSFK